MSDDGEEDWDYNPEPDEADDAEEGNTLSLDALSASFAQLIGHSSASDSPQAEVAEDETDDDDAGITAVAAEGGAGASSVMRVRRPAEPDPDELLATPLNVLEAILFVGDPSNEPVTSQQIVSLIRGVEAAEVDQLVQQLNETYTTGGCPYEIVSIGAGYRLTLRPEYIALRDKFYGKVREAKLTQGAIDILSIVAYQQPITRKGVESICQKPSGAILNQLVRRQLIRIERSEENPREPFYLTTDRFLSLFGLSSLDELPRSETLDRQL